MPSTIDEMYPSLREFVHSYQTDLIHYREQTFRFLAALAQIDVRDVTSHPFCFQIIKQVDVGSLPVGSACAISRHQTGSFTSLEPWLRSTNLPEHGGFCGAYVCVNKTDERGRKKENVTSVRALFVELDHGGLSQSHIQEFQTAFRPSIIIESSPGKLHAYWLLASGSCPLEKFSAVQQLLQARFVNLRAGKEAKDLPRVLRLPGFLHLKDLNSPFVVTLHHCEPSLIYDPQSIFECLGIDEDFVKKFQESPDQKSLQNKSVSPEIAQSVSRKHGEFLGAASGLRNESMYHYCLVHLFQHRGLNPLEALAICKDANQKNNPPLDPSELESIVQSAWKKFAASGGNSAPPPGRALEVLSEWTPDDTASIPSSYTQADGTESWEEHNFSYNYDSVLMHCPVSDESLADRIIQKYGSKINHAEVGGFYVYNDLIWANSHGEGRRIVRSWMGETFASVPYEVPVQEFFATPKGGLDGKRWGAFKRDIHSTFRIRSVLGALAERLEIATTPDQFNREEESDVIACPNGILDLSLGKIVLSDPKYRLTHLMGAAHDPTAHCPTWDYFVSSCMGNDKKLVRYLQKITGYFLSGRTHLQCVFVAFGKSGTGKSVYLSVMSKLLAGYFKELHKNTLISNSGSENAKMSSLAQAVHCRLATIAETSSKDIWDESLVKQISGNDPVTAKLSHKDTIAFQPRFKVCIRANELPTSEQLDEAMWTRMKFIPFEVRFRGTAEEDPFLIEKLSNELSGVLNWAVKGYQMLLLDGLGEPELALKQKKDSMREAEPVRIFVEEVCESCAHKDGLKYGEFQNSFESFCRDRGLPIHGKKQIKKLLLGELGYSELNSWSDELSYSERKINLKIKVEWAPKYSTKSNLISIKKEL